jgi:hypothetical protein
MTPLQLQLSADSVAAPSAHAEAFLADMKAWEDVALAARIESAAA